MIITFYSYKGGLGRSMVVANLAVLLASDGYRVIVVDWDLESPGIHRYFDLEDKDLAKDEVSGVMEYVVDFKGLFATEQRSDHIALPDLDDYLLTLTNVLPDLADGLLRFMPAGRLDASYGERIGLFDWRNFYKHWHGGRAIEYLKEQLLDRAEYVLVDSRTGLTDIGGICTMQLPSVLVVVMGSNSQSIDGALNVIKRVKGFEHPPKILPLPSRVDTLAEVELKQDWLQSYPKQFSVPPEIGDAKEYFRNAIIPYQPRYSYGETLAVLKETEVTPGTVVDACQRLKNYIQLLDPRPYLRLRVGAAYRKRRVLGVELDVDLAGHLIDVYVETKSADRPLRKTAVEVKDRDRPVGVDVINEFATIVENLQGEGLVDEGVIVSASGFSEQARNTARARGLRLEDLTDLGIESRVTKITEDTTARARNRRVADSYRARLSRLGRDLERQVADAYRAIGARRVEHEVGLAGNQVDLYVEIESPDRGLHRIAVEVKDWRKTVGIDVINGFALIVNNLRNRARLVDEGVVVSASGFSKQARNAAETHGIRLLEPADLVAIESSQVTPKQYATLVGDVAGPVHAGRGDIIIFPTDLEFADREAELRILLSPIGNPGAPRYVQVHAPSGLGKTYLLRKASSEYEAAGWLCAWLDFSSDARLHHNAMSILKQLSGQFGGSGERARTSADLAGQVMRARKQSVIFLDAVDLASGEIRRWIKMDLIPSLEERLPDPKLKPYFIAASRHPIREWAVYSRQRFEVIALMPFNDTVVDDLLRRLAETVGYRLPESFFQQTTEMILFITKGHPACIRRVLQEIQGRNFTISPQEIAQAGTFNRIVGDVLDREILAFHVSQRSREVFKTLCAFRGYTPSLLDRLARGGWLPARERIGWDLESELQGTYLVEIPNGSPLYRIEPLIRQLVALQMEYNDKERFLELNQVALEVFEEQVKGRDKHGDELPRRAYDRMQVALAVEALYHQATLLRLDKADRDRARSRLLDMIKEYPSYRLTEKSQHIVDTLSGGF